MHHWYVVQVLSGQERKAKRNLEEYREAKGMSEIIQEVLLPTEQVAELKQGKQTVTERRLWPGYLLVKMEMTDESWGYVKNSNGVIDFLGGGAPAPLSDQEVESILSDLRAKEGTVTQKHQFKSGDKVRINDGVFVNFLGTVIDVFHDKAKMSVMVSIFGRETRVDDLEFWQVEEVNDESEVT